MGSIGEELRFLNARGSGRGEDIFSTWNRRSRRCRPSAGTAVGGADRGRPKGLTASNCESRSAALRSGDIASLQPANLRHRVQ